MKDLPSCSVDSIVTDPPYGIGIIEEEWDTMTPVEYQDWCSTWASEALRVAKPGAFLVAFSATRTHHRLIAGIEDAGWEIRDCGVWMYRSGHPKNRNAGALIDSKLGVDGLRTVTGTVKMNDTTKSRAGFTGLTSKDGKTHVRDVEVSDPYSPLAKLYEGWSMTLKPGIEPWCLARKPLEGTIADNLIKHGTGVLNIPGCKIPVPGEDDRYPANVLTLLDDDQFNVFRITGALADFKKASSAERPYTNGEGDVHVTVKPLDLMRYLIRLVTPKNGTVLEPFAGSGTTLEAALIEGFDAIGIELDPRYIPIIETRMGRPMQQSLEGLL